MATSLIELEEGILVEVQVDDAKAEQISGTLIEKVGSSFEKITPILLTVSKRFKDAWAKARKEVSISKAEIELGIGFDAEGNLYVTKAKASANITVKLYVAPPEMTAVNQEASEDD